jgi:hypothetical protein
MVPVEWPVAAADEREAAPPARAAGRGRLPVARVDFFLDPRDRLSEQERALMAGMLADLVASITDELRVELSGFEPANDDGERLFDDLRFSGLLDIPPMVALLLRRAEEERIAGALRSARGPARPRFLQSLVGDEHQQVAAAAMALILARGRRRDRFERPRLVFDDLPAEAAVALVNSIAAWLRCDLAKRFGSANSDERLREAAQSVLSRHDEGNRLEVRLFELAHALDSAGRIDDSLVLEALGEGEAALLAEILGRRAGIAFDASWEHLAGSGGRLALLLRMSCIPRDVAGEIVVRLADVVGSDTETEIGAFDSLSEEQVEQARKWLRLDESYRAAVHALGEGDGHRAL